MLDSEAQFIPERLLQGIISLEISRKLGAEQLEKNLAQFTKDMNEEDAREAKFLFLEQIRNGFEEFYAKLKKSIERSVRPDEG